MFVIYFNFEVNLQLYEFLVSQNISEPVLRCIWDESCMEYDTFIEMFILSYLKSFQGFRYYIFCMFLSHLHLISISLRHSDRSFLYINENHSSSGTLAPRDVETESKTNILDTIFLKSNLVNV